MLKRLLGSWILASAVSALGIQTVQKTEKKLAGDKALTIRGLMARHTVMAMVMRRLKQRRSKPGS